MKQTQRMTIVLLCVFQEMFALWVVFVGFAHGFMLSSCSSPDSAPCNANLGVTRQTVMIAGPLIVATRGTVFAFRLNSRGRSAWWIPAIGCVAILLFWWAGSSMLEASLSR